MRLQSTFSSTPKVAYFYLFKFSCPFSFCRSICLLGFSNCRDLTSSKSSIFSYICTLSELFYSSVLLENNDMRLDFAVVISKILSEISENWCEISSARGEKNFSSALALTMLRLWKLDTWSLMLKGMHCHCIYEIS